MKKSKIRETIEAVASALLIAFFIRAFLFEAFKIPSGSMIPTLLVGDHIFVNKFIYGLRIPFTHHYLSRFAEPKRGDVVVFIFPVEEDKDFIKRIVGIPGDRLEILGNSIRINGEDVLQEPVVVEAAVAPAGHWQRLQILPQADAKESGIREIPFFPGWRNFDFYLERLGSSHIVQYDRYGNAERIEAAVPPDFYFVMGDNRDNSADSREWGFVSRTYLKGKAMFVWLSWDSDRGGVRWRRFGTWIR